MEGSMTDQSLLLSAALTLQWTAAVPAVADPQNQAQARAAQMRFQGMGRNNDGQISREEWRGSARSFEVHDWNGDGRLSGPEVRIGGSDETAIEQADHDPSRTERFIAWTSGGFDTL